MDKDLIHALMRNAACRKVFFTEIDSVMVFDKVKFGWIVSNRQFLPDSYTRFKNKIGLVDTNGDYISGSRSVELVFPYKDCVLEGGQTKEEQKRQEIFYNETLAPDEVDRLLAPKVMTNAILHQKGNNRRALEITDKDNLIIMGNNLLSLSSMLSRYEEKIKCVYIDPPYHLGLEEETLRALEKSKIIDEETLIIIEADKYNDLEFIGETNFKVVREKIYKTNRHYFIKLGGQEK